jgi:methyl-accepting chemotaxis protein
LKRRTGAISKRLRWILMGLGLLAGGVLMACGLVLMKPNSAPALFAFVFVCLAAGTAVGFSCYAIALRVAESELSGVLESASEGMGLHVNRAEDFESIAAELDRLFRDAGSTLRQVRAITDDIRALTSEALAATEQAASGAAEQAAAVTQTSATVEELAQTSKQIADNSQSVAAVAERTLASAEEGMQTVADTAAGIEEIRESTQIASDRILALGERSQEIGRVLVIIDDIAEQTKILALNAAIEAARAGEAGKGFAVVAEEIRKLADSVTESTSEIGRVVREIQSSSSSLVMSTEKASKKVEEGKMLAGRTADSLDTIVSQVEETTDSAKQISIATQQQRSASEQVVISMREMAQVATQAAQASRQIQSAITELNRLADSVVIR